MTTRNLLSWRDEKSERGSPEATKGKGFGFLWYEMASMVGATWRISFSKPVQNFWSNGAFAAGECPGEAFVAEGVQIVVADERPGQVVGVQGEELLAIGDFLGSGSVVGYRSREHRLTLFSFSDCD